MEGGRERRREGGREVWLGVGEGRGRGIAELDAWKIRSHKTAGDQRHWTDDMMMMMIVK